MLKVLVRGGSWSIPPFRPTELTDAEIEDIAAYLAEVSKPVSNALTRPASHLEQGTGSDRAAGDGER